MNQPFPLDLEISGFTVENGSRLHFEAVLRVIHAALPLRPTLPTSLQESISSSLHNARLAMYNPV